MQCLQWELTFRKHRFVTQQAVPIVYRGVTLDARYRIDLMVQDIVIVEMKSVEQLAPVHSAQILTYMALLACPAGLLINFNVAKLVDGVKRFVLTGLPGLRQNAERRRHRRDD
jgi:GxxExxY protein